MDRTRWMIVPIALITLLNLPAVFATDGDTGPTGSGVAGTVVGVLGVVAVVALARRLSWSRPAAFAVGVLNVAGGAWVLAAGYGNGAVGLILGLIITVLAASAPVLSTQAARP